jgi:hypothetical protein
VAKNNDSLASTKQRQAKKHLFACLAQLRKKLKKQNLRALGQKPGFLVDISLPNWGFFVETGFLYPLKTDRPLPHPPCPNSNPD